MKIMEGHGEMINFLGRRPLHALHALHGDNILKVFEICFSVIRNCFEFRASNFEFYLSVRMVIKSDKEFQP